MKEFSLFRTRVRNEETEELTSASGTSEVTRAVKFTTSESVSEVAEAAGMLYLGKVGLLQSESGLKEAVAIPIVESGRQSPREKDGKLFFAEGGRGHFENYPLSQHTHDWNT